MTRLVPETPKKYKTSLGSGLGNLDKPLNPSLHKKYLKRSSKLWGTCCVKLFFLFFFCPPVFALLLSTYRPILVPEDGKAILTMYHLLPNSRYFRKHNLLLGGKKARGIKGSWRKFPVNITVMNKTVRCRANYVKDLSRSPYEVDTVDQAIRILFNIYCCCKAFIIFHLLGH